MTDIVERLRSSKQYDFVSPEMQRWQRDRLDAADEIERLRGQLNTIEEDGTEEHNAAIALRQEVARLRGALAEIADPDASPMEAYRIACAALEAKEKE